MQCFCMKQWVQLISPSIIHKMVIPRAHKKHACCKPHSLKDTCMKLHRNWGKKKILNVIKISQIYTRSKTFQIFPKLFLPKKILIIIFFQNFLNHFVTENLHETSFCQICENKNCHEVCTWARLL